ncbi:MAG: MmgE/PrpD family protein, partial [Gammaproteobacteria bacterium]|nr:MmgE/PrpD family protein [Gammaproteobacteria bacterium]
RSSRAPCPFVALHSIPRDNGGQPATRSHSMHVLITGANRGLGLEFTRQLLARGDRVVHNDRDARVSIHHCAAAALLWGAAGIREFSSACVFDPDAVALRARVTAGLDADMPVGAARVSVTLRDGQRHTHTVLHARGSIQQPLSDEDLERKLRDLTREGPWLTDSLLGHLWRLESLDDIGGLLDLITRNPVRG